MEINFIFRRNIIKLQCQYNEIMRNVFKKFFLYISCKNPDSFFFLYNGDKVNENLTVIQTANYNDQIQNKMKIIVGEEDESSDLSLFQNKNKIKYTGKIMLNIIYQGNKTEFEYESGEKMGNVFKTFFDKEEINDPGSFYFLYGGDKLDKNQIINQISNYYDKLRKKMVILAIEHYIPNNKPIIKKSKQVICPTCCQSALIKLKNCKISICECRHHHKNDDLDIKDFISSQNINETKIICGKCKDINKGSTYHNVFYICNTCNLNLCPLCKSIHDKTHNIIDFDNSSFECGIHNELFSLYCKTCKKNICILCEQDHDDHEVISYAKLTIKNNDLENKLKQFKISIEKFKEDIERIKNIFQNVINYCENLYKISDELIHNFDMKQRNYEVLSNLKELYNEDTPKQLNNIINSNNYIQKITQIFKMYNNINNNELNISDPFGDKKTLKESSSVNMKNRSEKENELMEEISKKNSEIERLLSLLPFKINPGEKLMTVIFTSSDQKIHYSIICKNTEKFNALESRLYDIYPEFSETDNYFISNGRKIARFKDLDYNKIKNSDIITLYMTE